METRHVDALRRIAQADAAWARDGHEPRPFMLVPRGGLQRHIDHPRWDSSWAVPSGSTLDDLAEMEFIRVEPFAPGSTGRTFSFTMQGRNEAQRLIAPPQQATAPLPSGDPAPTALVSWAHSDSEWQATVVEFTYKLRELGIAADADLFHLHDRAVVWTTYGPRAIEESEFVLILASPAYKARWEGTNPPGTGAGAAREANTLKAGFDDDQGAFHRKVKVVVLPGATTADIPTELRAAAQRFEIASINEAGLEDLLRTLTNQPAFVPPAVGRVPLLPPKSVGPTRATPRQKDAIADAISKLPDRQKLVIALMYFEELTRDEVADILAVAPDEVARMEQMAITSLGPVASAVRGLSLGLDS
jgi:SEFIR domain/Sigma-70, region 4